MRILLCGEGQHELGEDEVWDERAESWTRFDGWMQTLVRRLTAKPTEFSIRKRAQIFANLGGRQRPARLAGHAEKARWARFMAQQEGFDVVIYMADADSADRGRWREIVREIEAGFDAVADGPAAIVCVPMSTSESWFLADLTAWRAAGLPRVTILPRWPERSWGVRSDPLGGHPHQVFARACADAALIDSTRVRVEIALVSDISVLRGRCPISFPPFADAVAAL